MKIRHDVSDDFFSKGFVEGTDPFGRKDLADRLNNLYRNLQQGTVSILDGRWGTGKSYFVRQWKHHLESDGIPAIYLDAFAMDYIESPFRAVASAFIRAAKDARKLDEDAYDRFLSATSKVLKSVAAPAAKIVVKGVTLGLVGSNETDSIAKVAEALSSDLGDISEASLKALLEEQAADEINFKALQKSLAELPDLLTKNLRTKTDKKDQDDDRVTSLVVIIDELDRCRPDFALGVLEVLKHFFRAEGVHFVLVTNMDHLILSVNSRYGVGDAAAEYIQKFYDFVIPFEQRDRNRRSSNAADHASRLLNIMLTSAQTQLGFDLIETTAEIITSYNLSLRQAERVVTNIVLAQAALKENSFRPNILVAFMASLKAINSSLFSQIKKGDVNHEQLTEFINKGTWPGDRSKEDVTNIIHYYSLKEIDASDPRFRNFGQISFRYNFSNRLEVLPYIANSVIDRFS